MIGSFFWKLLTAACLLWYSTITVYVAFRGFRDIREMLRRLKASRSERETRSVTSDEEEKSFPTN